MKVAVDRHYDIGVDRLYEILTSEHFYEQRHEWSKVEEYRFDAFHHTDEGFLIRIIQPVSINTEKIPAFARKLVPDQADLKTEFLWHNRESLPYRADYGITLGNVPVAIQGVMELSGDEQHATQHTQVEVTSHIPLLGKKLVSLVGKQVNKALDGDYRHTLRYVEAFG